MNRDAAVEAVSRALEREFGGFLAHDPYNPQRFWTMTAAAVIDAALPHLVPRPERVIKAEALREAAEEAYALERAEDPTRAAFYWLHARARRIERGEL